MMDFTKISVTFQDAGDSDRDLAVRFRMPSVPRVDEHYLLGKKLYVITRVVWKSAGDIDRRNEMDVYVRCLYLETLP